MREILKERETRINSPMRENCKFQGLCANTSIPIRLRNLNIIYL